MTSTYENSSTFIKKNQLNLFKMSSKICAKCSKTVYPIEELKCLDKIWHKICFKCHECGMTLNMRNYKGFDKLPYCEAHIPKAKATTMADTPELKRIQENTKIQSNAAYHAEFEKSKGKFTQISDDPELMRIKQNSKIISNVTYHGDLEKKKAMEEKRNLTGSGENNYNTNGGTASTDHFLKELSSVPVPQQHQPQHHQQQQYHHQPPPPQQAPQYVPPPAANYNNRGQGQNIQSTKNYHHQEDSHHNTRIQQQQQHHHQQQNYHHQQQQQQQHQIMNHHQSPYSTRVAPNVIYSSDIGAVNANSSRKVGSIADYDPINNQYGSINQTQQPRMSAQQQLGRVPQSYQQQHQQHQQHIQQQQQQHHQQQHTQQHQQQQHVQHQQYMPQQYQQQQRSERGQGGGGQIRFRALYDYEAQDTDEISFSDGDLIVECTAEEEGWMTGTVQRTGKRGLLPANYVASVN